MSRFLVPRLERLSDSGMPTDPDSDFEEPTQQTMEEPTQIWTGGSSIETRAAIPRPALSTFDDRAHPDLRLYDAVSGEPTDVIPASEAFRQLERAQRAGHERPATRPSASATAETTEPFADATVPDLGTRGSMPSISVDAEQFRTRVSFSVPMFVLFVLLCVSTGAFLAWAYTYRLAGAHPFGSLLGG